VKRWDQGVEGVRTRRFITTEIVGEDDGVALILASIDLEIAWRSSAASSPPVGLRNQTEISTF
jgi:hypothetical protein